MSDSTKSIIHEPLLHRHPSNPILTARQWPYRVNTVFNPGATRLKDGSTLLLCRVEDMRGHSHLTAARSQDGITDWQIDPRPTFEPDLVNHPEELWGVEDPRITYVPEFDRYAVLYTSYSHSGPGVSMAMTDDFHTFDRLGVVATPEDKDAALLPYRIKDQWMLIHRPVGPLGAHMWLSSSPDLEHWGNHRIMLEARRGAWWDANKIGLCNPPIETDQGWLVVYHGVRTACAGCIYRMGLALFDKESPDVCLIRGEEWIIGPEESYEIVGDVGYVVFPCGHTVGDDGDTLHLYYGAADTSIGLMTGSIRQMLAWLETHGRRYARRAGEEVRDQDRRL
jgi:predicted GH43/DUF377 family glycosyl hydrolase